MTLRSIGLGLATALAMVGCYNTQAVDLDDSSLSDSSESGSTSSEEAGTSGSTSDNPEPSDSSTGPEACPTGAFDRARFDEACFGP